MIRKTLLAATLTAGSMMIAAAPAHATWGGGWDGWGGGKDDHKSHYCGCGHKTCGGSSGGSSGSTTSSGGSTSGGTQVPEPGMVGILGLGLIGMAYARRRGGR